MAVPYGGPTRKLVFALDVGTTQTGISYCILQPGEISQKRSMHKFPGQEYTHGSHKIPTVLYYNKDGDVEAAGAETLSDEVIEKASEEGWLKVQWFKLRLRPKHVSFEFNNSDLGPLPANKTVDDIFADFYAYLFECCESFIKEVHPAYATAWDELADSAEFVLCHPNGWGGAQQGRMRRSAVKAGLVPDTAAGRSRVQFVTEGEASLHYCHEEHHLNMGDEGLIVADLGGGTLDFSAYKVESRDPIVFLETAATKCAIEGSEIITRRAKSFLADKLKDSKYGTEDDIGEMVKVFDNRSKRIFRCKAETIYIPFGRVSDKDPAFGVIGGKLKLTGADLADIFEPSISTAQELITKCILASPVKIAAVYLIGGLSENSFVKSELINRFKDAKLEIRAPGSSSVKAAALGALGFYFEHYVKARVAKASYGVEICVPYLAPQKDHLQRGHTMYTDYLTGECKLSGAFSTILHKGTSVEEKTMFKRAYFRSRALNAPLHDFEISEKVFAFHGPGKTIDWIDEASNDDELKVVCRVEGDLTALRETSPHLTSPDGILYQNIHFKIVLWFGGPELLAELHWKENGLDKKGPATIIYEDDCVAEHDPESVRT